MEQSGLSVIFLLFGIVTVSLAIYPYRPVIYARDVSYTPSFQHVPQNHQRLQMASYFNSRRPYPYRYQTPPNGYGAPQRIIIRPSTTTTIVPVPVIRQPHQPTFKWESPPRLQKGQFYLRPVSHQNNLRVIPQVVARVESATLKFQPSRPVHQVVPKSAKYKVEEFSNDEDSNQNSNNHHQKSSEESHEESHEENFNEKKGSDHEDEWHKGSGEKSEKEYKSEHENKKGKKGEHFEEDESGNYSEEKGHKKEHHDESDDHGTHHESKKGEKGGKVSEKKGHKKGSKTSGYHNVFHKDEYKKDHTFYDTADHKGNFHKYGGEHKDHHKKSGHKEKGHKHDSDHDEKNNSKKGHTDKGHYDKDDTGYEKKEGNEKTHKDNEEYQKEKGEKAGKEFSFKGQK